MIKFFFETAFTYIFARMFTVKYELFSDIDRCDNVVKNIYVYGKDLVTEFKTIEFNITEASDLTYIVMISEAQREIFLKNIDSLILLYLRLKANNKLIFAGNFRGLRRLFDIEDRWEECACGCLFSSIFELFRDIDKEKQIYYSNDIALSEITIMVKRYLIYLGKEDKLDEVMKKVTETEGRFREEEDIILPLELLDGEFRLPKEFPRTIKYEVRYEINGVLYATTSEESAKKFFEYRKKIVKLAYKHFDDISEDLCGDEQVGSVFYERMLGGPAALFESMLAGVVILVRLIAGFQMEPDSQIVYVTSRHLEEIHILAQECLKIKFFDLHYSGFSKEIKSSAQLAQLIDTHFKTLDPPTGSKTKPAIRSD